jgi:hypothetical protein
VRSVDHDRDDRQRLPERPRRPPHPRPRVPRVRLPGAGRQHHHDLGDVRAVERSASSTPAATRTERARRARSTSATRSRRTATAPTRNSATRTRNASPGPFRQLVGAVDTPDRPRVQQRVFGRHRSHDAPGVHAPN